MAYKQKQKNKDDAFWQSKKWIANQDEVEAEGIELESYPTDNFDGSNTGDGTLYYYKGKFFEITKERYGSGITFGELSQEVEEPLRARYKKFIK